MNFLQQLFFILVYQPFLNLIQFYFNLTKDIGLSIILIGITVNLLLWPLILESYLSSQKLRILQPKIKKIQDKYKPKLDQKTDLQSIMQMQKEIKELYQKHGVNMGVTWQIILVQLIVGTAIFSLVSQLSENGEISGLYEFIFQKTQTNFPQTAFKFLEINKTANNYLWLPLIGLVFSYFYGKYTFDWSPKLNLEKISATEKKDIPNKEESNFDIEAFQASQKTTILYVLPLLTFFFNMNWSVGVTLYFVTLTVTNFFRQVAISQYYGKYLNKLIDDIADSDPSDRDLQATNVPIIDIPVATVVQKKLEKVKIKNKKLKKFKKLTIHSQKEEQEKEG